MAFKQAWCHRLQLRYNYLVIRIIDIKLDLGYEVAKVCHSCHFVTISLPDVTGVWRTIALLTTAVEAKNRPAISGREAVETARILAGPCITGLKRRG